ncbi:hypothetical protein ABPG75_006356 [Micractinium tetrahymenae]
MDSELVSAPPLPFSIKDSPFAARGPPETAEDDSRALQAAIAAATQPVGGKRPRPEDAADGDAAKPQSPPPRQGAGGKHRPPRPPSFADSSSLALDLTLLQRQATAQQAGGSPRQAGRSPRIPAGGGASPAVRRPAKQLSKTQGRICIECGTSSTTQWRSQGLLCNSCGVKLIKGRLPMDADSMHRRFLRLPPAIRDHPMWAAAQVVAAAQGRAAAAVAAGQPWSCPGCGQQGGERVAGPCGLHQCAACVGRYHLPLGGAAAIAAAVAAPPGALTPSPSPSPGGRAGAPGSAHKRRKQATPRSAHGGLSPASISSSGSSSIQAYSFRSAREEGIDDVTSKEPSPHHARPARRPRQQHARHATPAGAAALAPHLARPALDTPTAAEAAAALLVLTESDELRVAQAARMDAAAVAAPQPAAGAAGDKAEPALQARVPPVTPAEREPPTTAGKAGSGKPPAARSLGTALGQPQGGGGGSPAPEAGPGAAAAALAGDDAVGLYQLLIDASGAPEGAAAGLTAELVGRFLAAHTMQAQAEQQARLVALMVRQGQVTAAVSLMQGVVKLAGLAA